MTKRTTAAALIAAALLTLTACESTDTNSGSNSKPSKASNDKADTNTGTAKAETASLPDMAGKGLQSAQDQAQEAGFYSLLERERNDANQMVLVLLAMVDKRRNPADLRTPGAGAAELLRGQGRPGRGQTGRLHLLRRPPGAPARRGLLVLMVLVCAADVTDRQAARGM
ncbi:hypothetical protein ABZ703_43215, partial [Streptomyces massasporeus]